MRGGLSERSSILLMGRNTVVMGAVVITVASFAIGYFLGFKGGGSPEQEKQAVQNTKAGDLLPLEEKRVIDLPVKDAPGVPVKPSAAQPTPVKQPEQVAEASSQKPAEAAASVGVNAAQKNETRTAAAPAGQPQAHASAPDEQASQAAKPGASSAKTAGHSAGKTKKKANGGASSGKLYAVQMGAFPSKEGAEQLYQNLKASGLKPYIVNASDGNSYFKVRIGNFKNKKAAEKSAAALSKKTGLQNFVTAAQ